MSFTKARDLIELAKMAHARHGGVTLEEICDRFQVTHRTAQRMTVALEETFSGIENPSKPDRRKAWKLADPVPAALSPPVDESIEALDFATRALANDCPAISPAKAAATRPSSCRGNTRIP